MYNTTVLEYCMVLYCISLWYYNFWSWVWVWVSWWSFLLYKGFCSAGACLEADCGQEQWFHTPSSGHQQHQTQLALSCSAHLHLLNSDNKYIHTYLVFFLVDASLQDFVPHVQLGHAILWTWAFWNCFYGLCSFWCQLLGHPNVQDFWLCTSLKHFWPFFYKHFNMTMMLIYTDFICWVSTLQLQNMALFI